MMFPSRMSKAAVGASERRQREDAAVRLRAQVPELLTLEMAIEERRGASPIAESRHVRRFVVERAPAMFELPCADHSCQNGGHDVTREVLTSLRGHQRRFEGEHTCDGTIGSGVCGRVLRYVGTATFRE